MTAPIEFAAFTISRWIASCRTTRQLCIAERAILTLIKQRYLPHEADWYVTQLLSIAAATGLRIALAEHAPQLNVSTDHL